MIRYKAKTFGDDGEDNRLYVTMFSDQAEHKKNVATE